MRFGTPTDWAPTGPARDHRSHYRPQKTGECDSNYSILEAKSQVINASLGKRAIDLSIAYALIIFLLPALVVIALAIKATSPGPVLFRQQRYGVGKRTFWILKFRTMAVQEMQGAFVQASRNDVRITLVGSWLRRSSLDELPQLFNVMGGSMSLVGPRPHAVPMDDYYSEIIPGYSARHLVRPGITGLAQINGYRGPTDELQAITSRIAHDVEYIHRWSVLTDVKVLCRTPMVLFGRNAF
jgi:putative colanic acid biosysnthesis UDP-glucose lipid carrier transferase